MKAYDVWGVGQAEGAYPRKLKSIVENLCLKADIFCGIHGGGEVAEWLKARPC